MNQESSINHRKRVVITGLGVVTSIGIGKDEFWDNLIAGKSGISEVTAFDTSQHFTHRGGEVKNFKPEDFIEKETIPHLSRATQLGLAAVRLALRDSNINFSDGHRVATCMGTTVGSTQVIEHINDQLLSNKASATIEALYAQLSTNTTPSCISHDSGLSGPNFLFSTACAAGNYAIGFGFDLIKLNKTHTVIAGGYEPYSRISFTGFNQFQAVAPERCQPFDKNRKGMMVAEGAGVLILESLEHALDRGANIYAEILGYGLSCDAHHMTNPVVESISKCMKKAFKDAHIASEDVDYISAHGTGTPANDRTECAAIKNVFGERYKEVPISSIKSMIGHTMGAASAIEAIACALTVQNNIIPPTINFEIRDPECDIDCVANKSREQKVNIALNNSYAFGGNNASLVIKKFMN